MGKQMNCYHCNKEITDRADLVVANRKFILRPYHKKCFKEHIDRNKGQSKMFFDAMPVNSTYGNVMTFIFLVLLVILYLFVETNILIYIICLIFPIYRLFSWILLERRLN